MRARPDGFRDEPVLAAVTLGPPPAGGSRSAIAASDAWAGARRDEAEAAKSARPDVGVGKLADRAPVAQGRDAVVPRQLPEAGWELCTPDAVRSAA